MNVVFMGTPDFSVECLKTVNELYDVVGVFTQPDKPVGRKMVMTPPAVKVTALELGLTVYQPDSVKTDESYELIKKLSPELIVVVAYGKILPKRILDLPKYGCVNVHASLLPKFRGASPIQAAVLAGEKVTGVTTMLMDEGMDTGDILLTEELEIAPDDTAGTMFDKLSVTGAELLKKTLPLLINNQLTPKKQDETAATYCGIIKKEMAHLDFTKTTDEVINTVRGFSPWPVAYFIYGGKRVKVFSASSTDENGEAGRVVCSDGRLVIATEDGAVEINELQFEGAKRMKTADALRGKTVLVGAKVE